VTAILVHDLSEEATSREQAIALLDVGVIVAEHALDLAKATKGAGVVLQLSLVRELRKAVTRIQELVAEADDCCPEYTRKSAVAKALLAEVAAVKALAHRVMR